MLDDGAGGRLFRIELRDQFVSRVGVVDVVVGELFALQLLGGGDAETFFARRHKTPPADADSRRSAVSGADGPRRRAGAAAPRRRLSRAARRTNWRRRRHRRPCAHRRLRELAAQRVRRRAVIGVHFREHDRIVFGIDDDRDPVVVLGGRADHRRAADVDVLDRLVEIRTARDRRFEGIEIADEEIDAFDAVRAHGFGVIGLVAQREKAAMDFRMQRLHAAVHDFGKAGDAGDVVARQVPHRAAPWPCRRSRSARCRDRPAPWRNRSGLSCRKRKAARGGWGEASWHPRSKPPPIWPRVSRAYFRNSQMRSVRTTLINRHVTHGK